MVIVCHFNFVLQRVYACKILSYFIQLYKKANSLLNCKLLLAVGCFLSEFWLYFHLMSLHHPVKTMRCCMTTSVTICCYHLSRGVNQENDWFSSCELEIKLEVNIFSSYFSLAALINQEGWCWHIIKSLQAMAVKLVTHLTFSEGKSLKSWRSELLPWELSNSLTHLSFPSGICVTFVPKCLWEVQRNVDSNKMQKDAQPRRDLIKNSLWICQQFLELLSILFYCGCQMRFVSEGSTTDNSTTYIS